MHAPLLPEDFSLTPDNDPSPAPFGAFAPNAAQAAIISLAHRSRLKRGAFRPMLSRLVNLLRAGPVDVQYQGASFRFYHQASATERGALFNPAYNIEELDFLRAHVPAGGVFVDVGANVGTYALALARHVGAGGKVIAIEPHPVTHARLASTTRLGYSQVRLVAAAAGPRWRIADRDRRRQSRRQPHRVGRGLRQGDQGAVAAAAAHSREAGVSHVDALKIDVEGFEDRVLTGFFADAPQALWPRAIVIEHL
jgi:FkbM family methyltransferase